MRWRMAWVCALLLLGLLGCVRTFGPGGSIRRAIKKDQQEMLSPPVCPSEAELELLCEYPEDDICPRECLPK